MKKSLQRIEQLRQQPEDARLRAAIVMTIAISLILAFIALVILLPLQLYLM